MQALFGFIFRDDWGRYIPPNTHQPNLNAEFQNRETNRREHINIRRTRTRK
jgi:hypothetical protein